MSGSSPWHMMHDRDVSLVRKKASIVIRHLWYGRHRLTDTSSAYVRSQLVGSFYPKVNLLRNAA